MPGSSHVDPLPADAELHCLSSFSFQRGASLPEELVARAAALGYTALAITDECSVAGVVRAHTQAKELGLKLLLGAGIGFSNALFLPHGTPNSAAWDKTQRPARLNPSLDAG